MRVRLTVCFSLMLFGCGDANHVDGEAKVVASTRLEYPVNPAATSDEIALLKSAAEQLASACPGLINYRQDVNVVSAEVRNNCSANFEVVVSAVPMFVPTSYYANGHHCFFEVGQRTPPGVRVAKSACASICEDKSIESDARGSDFFLPISPSEPADCALAEPPELFAGAVEPTFEWLVDRVDARRLIAGLPLKNRQKILSGAGSLKFTWDIPVVAGAGMEIIGDDQSHADVMAWRCQQYDAQGNGVPELTAGSACRQLLISVLRNVVSQPEQVATYLLARAQRFAPKDMVLRGPNLSIEVGEGFYFVRKVGG